MSVADKLKAINATIKAAMADADKLAKDAVAEVAKSVFDAHPKVKSFTLVGYTPSFNDGDPCTFGFETSAHSINGYGNPSCGEDFGKQEGDKPEDADWDDGRRYDAAKREVVQHAEPGWAAAANKSIREAFGLFTEDQIERLFGSNFRLDCSIQSDGGVKVEKEEYDCGY